MVKEFLKVHQTELQVFLTSLTREVLEECGWEPTESSEEWKSFHKSPVKQTQETPFFNVVGGDLMLGWGLRSLCDRRAWPLKKEIKEWRAKICEKVVKDLEKCLEESLRSFSKLRIQ